MTGGEVTMAVLEGDRRQFEQTLVKALRSRGNLLTLARCAGQLKLQVVEQRARELVGGESVVTDIERGRALWELLKEAIDRLRPANSEPEPTPAWRLYAIAEGVYVQGKSAKEVAAELGISPRTFHRERRAAVEALATVVWQIEGQMHPLKAAKALYREAGEFERAETVAAERVKPEE
jgi:AraC-like DNA-binding protein